MIVVQDVFDAFRLERMIIEFSWSKMVEDPDEIGKTDYIYQKYHDIFLNPDFIINNPNSQFVQIDIRKLYQEYSKVIKADEQVYHSPKSSPKSQDYLDSRLFSTPSDIIDLLLDEKKLDHKCFISFNESQMVADCNFEQLTLIMRIIENSLDFHSLIQTNYQFNNSSQTILPRFNTHSYTFSFEFSNGLDQLFDRNEMVVALGEGLKELTAVNKIETDMNYHLSGYDGIYVSLAQSDLTGSWVIRYEVSNIFTKSAMLLDRSSIQKTSLLFFRKLLESLKKCNSNSSENISKLITELSAYIT